MKSKKSFLDSRWKRLVVGLAAGAVLSASLGVGLTQSTSQKEHSAFWVFLASTENHVLSVFDKSTLKQKTIDSLPMLANYLQGKIVQPNTFGSNPQAYANWIKNQVKDDVDYYPVDFSKPGHQSLLLAQLARTISDLQRSNNPVENKSQDESRAFHPADFHHPDYELWLTHSLSARFKGMTLTGFGVIESSDQNEILIHTLDKSQPISSVLDTPERKKDEWLQWLVNMGKSIKELSIKVQSYDPVYVEMFSALGVKGQHTLERIESLMVDKNGYITTFASENPDELLLTALPRSEYRSLANGDEKLSEQSLLALNIAQQRHPSVFGESKIDVKDLAALAKTYSRRGVTSNDNLREAVTYQSIHDEIQLAQDNEVVRLFVQSIEKPCYPGVAKTIGHLYENPAILYAKECADNHSRGLPSLWDPGRGVSNSWSTDKDPSVLVGFQDDIAVFVYTDAAAPQGKSFSYIQRDKEQLPGAGLWITDLTNAMVVVNPFSNLLDGLSPVEKSQITEFTMHHEIFHAKKAMGKIGQESKDLDWLRSVSNEAQADVYASQQMLKAGYSVDEIINIHGNMSSALSETPNLMAMEFSTQEIKKARGGIWVGAELKTNQEVSALLAAGSSAGQLNSRFVGTRMQDVLKTNNALEFSARHKEVKDFLASVPNDFDADAVVEKKSPAQQ